jgi:hypothetical protein
VYQRPGVAGSRRDAVISISNDGGRAFSHKQWVGSIAISSQVAA